MSKLVGDDGRVFAFEPDPDNFKLLKENIDLNGFKNVILVNKAVLDKSGRGNLYLDPNYIGSHVMYNEHNGNRSI